MTRPSLSDDALQLLFAPSATYSDLGHALIDQTPDPGELKNTVDNALDELAISVTIHRAPGSEDDDPMVDTALEAKSRKAAETALMELGDTIVLNHRETLQGLREACLEDLHERLGVLDTPEHGALREVVTVQDAWMEAVGATQGLSDLFKTAASRRSAAWWTWFMGGLSAPGLSSAGGAEDAMAVLSRRALQQPSTTESNTFFEPWFDWCAKARGFSDSRVVHALHLASTLADPQRVLAAMLEAKGFEFSMARVDWPTAVAHTRLLLPETAMKVRVVEPFVLKHFETIVALDPAYAARAHEHDATWRAFPEAMARGLGGQRGLMGLLENVIDLEQRARLRLALDAAALTVSTETATAAPRSGPRL